MEHLWFDSGLDYREVHSVMKERMVRGGAEGGWAS